MYEYLRCNRYDMLCFEGIALNLNVFLGNVTLPDYRLITPVHGEIQTITVHEDVRKISNSAE